MKRLQSATHFVELDTDGKILVRTAGKLGGVGKTTRETFHNRAIAARKLNAAAYALEQQGYRVIHLAIRPQPRNAALEAQLRAARDDRGVYQVYGDWLQGQNSPIGELIALELGGHDGAAIRETLGLPDSDLATTEWKWGLWRALRIDNGGDPTDETFAAAALVAPLFASTLCGALEELRVGMLRWEHQIGDLEAVLLEAARYDWARDLRALHVGDVDRDVDMAHHRVGEIGASLSRRFPGLVELRVSSGDQDLRSLGLAKLALPRLESLVVETCSLTSARLAAILAGKLPVLAKLELWFGSANHDATASLADLRPLLAGKCFPDVRHLGLRNAECTDDLARAVPGNALAKRLEVLDLSMGTLGDAGAAELGTQRDRLERLHTLNVDDNFLTPGAIATLRAAFAGITVISNSQKTPFEGDERYVSVGE